MFQNAIRFPPSLSLPSPANPIRISVRYILIKILRIIYSSSCAAAALTCLGCGITEKNWWNWNLHRKTYEFFTSFCEYENFISSCAARLLSSTVLLLLANDRFIFFPLNGKQFYWSFVCKSCFQNGLGVEFNLCEVNIRFHARTLFLELYSLKFH